MSKLALNSGKFSLIFGNNGRIYIDWYRGVGQGLRSLYELVDFEVRAAAHVDVQWTLVDECGVRTYSGVKALVGIHKAT
jgi:hypothetical protein